MAEEVFFRPSSCTESCSEHGKVRESRLQGADDVLQYTHTGPGLGGAGEKGGNQLPFGNFG